MSRHVILLTDAHEAPAFELIEALRLAGVKTLIEGLRGASLDAAAPRRGRLEHSHEIEQPIAILYEVVAGADMVELNSAVEQARTSWPETPLVAVRRHAFHGVNFRIIDGATLKRLGFRAIADKPAQLPAILHEVEGHGATAELKLPEVVRAPDSPTALSLPPRMNSTALRAAYGVVSSLHFAGDQQSAALAALSHLNPLVRADRWTIYLVGEPKGSDAYLLEPLAMRTAADETATEEDNWRKLWMGTDDLPTGSESRAARLACAGFGISKRRERGQHVVAVPLVCGDRIIGVLEGMRDRPGFKKTEVAILDAMSQPIAAAMANAVRISEAERLSQTDDLTKLHNARYLRQFLLNEIRRARRYGSSVTALFLDLDNFKQVNDAHGHLAGSHVLMEMAAVILSSIRDTDAVARYGGDEFVIVLPDTGIDLGGVVADRIRTKISDHQFNGGRNLKLSLTASFGVAAFPEHASSPQQLIACADTAMYEAKAANKNCIRYSTSVGRNGKSPAELALQHGVVETDDENAFS